MNTKWLIAVALCCCAGSGRSSSDPDSPAVQDEGGGQEGQVDLKIASYEKIMASVKSHAGKVVVLDCWSTSCDPCMEEFPGLVRLHHKYPKQVACISLSLDYEGLGKPEDKVVPVLKFLNDQGATFDNFLSTDDSDSLFEKFDFAAPPAVFVYDQQGNQKKLFINDGSAPPFTYDDVEKLVRELITEESAEKGS